MILGRAVAAVARFMRHSRGNAMIQFALAGPVFLLLVFMILENGLVLFTQATLDNATRDAARLIMTNQVVSSSDFSTKLCAEARFLKCSSISFNVQSSASGFSSIHPGWSINSFGNMTGTTWSPGGTQDYVLVQVGYKRSYLVPWLGKIVGRTKSVLLLSTFAFQNEPPA